MGFADKVNDVINRGTAAAGRTTRQMQIKSRLNEISKQRHELAAQLGESLFEQVKDDAALQEGREDIVNAIVDLDVETDNLHQEQQEIEAEAAAAAAAANATARCSICNSPVRPEDRFCIGCGAEIVHAPVQNTEIPEGMEACPECGGAVQPDDLFCIKCGTRIERDAAEGASEAQDEIEEEVDDRPRCSNCKEPLEPDDKFCIKCGTAVS